MAVLVRWSSVVAIGLGAAACGGRVSAPEVLPNELPSLEAERARTPNDHQLLVRLGAGYYRANRSAEAVTVLRSALAIQPTFPAAVFLGLAFVLWGAEQLLPVSRWVTAMDCLVVTIFVIDLSLITIEHLKRKDHELP